MRKLFEYLTEKDSKSIKTAISVFVSNHKIWEDNEKLPSLIFLNQYSREDIANDFIDKKGLFNGYSSISSVSEERARLDIVEYIDLVIPRYYYIKKEKTKEENKKKSSEKIRNSYKGIENVNGLIFTIKENYQREKEYIIDRNSAIPVSMKEFNDLNYPYKKFSDEQLIQMVFKNCYKNKLMIVPEKEAGLRRIELLRILHYLYKCRDFLNRDKYLVTIDEYKKKYDKSIEHCFINTDKIKVGDFVTYTDCSTEMELLGGYNEADFINIGQVYNYNETNDEWKVNWIDMGLSEWEYSKSLRVLNPNVEPIRTVCENLFDKDIYDNYYYEEVEKYIKIGEYHLERDMDYIFSNGKMVDIKNRNIKLKLEKEMKSHNIYSHLRPDKVREYYLVEVSKDNPPVYFIDYTTSSNIDKTISNIVKEIRYMNRTEAEKAFEQDEINKRDAIVEFFYDEDYKTFAKRGYPTLKQLYFIGSLLNISYNSFKNIEGLNTKVSFCKCEYTGKYYLKPNINFKNLKEYYDVAVFIDNLKEVAYGRVDSKLKFLEQYFEI